MDHLRLGIVQYAPQWAAPERNLEYLETLLQNGPATDLVILPEMSLTGFVMDLDQSTLLTSHHEAMARFARERQSGMIYGGVEEGRNRLFLLDRQGERIGIYDKRHLFSLGHESETFTAGAECPTWQFEAWRIRPAICYDLRFPYHFWRGAESYDLVVVPACWPGSREAHWRSLLLARAIENQVWVAGVNRVGTEPMLKYHGASQVLEPSGKQILDAGEAEGIFLATISHEANRLVRHRFPFLKDRLES